jgi:hypothetical protein
MAGFDYWPPITGNPRLSSVLATFSAMQSPPLPPVSDSQAAEPPLWTLDTLFMLPRQRLKYYRKLYGRLLKSTTEGRSDHRLLTSAVERLDYLMQTLDERASIDVASVAPPPPVEMEDEVIMDMRQSRTSAVSDDVRNTETAPLRMSSPSERQVSLWMIALYSSRLFPVVVAGLLVVAWSRWVEHPLQPSPCLSLIWKGGWRLTVRSTSSP